MKIRKFRIAVVASAVVALLSGSVLVTNADYFAKPRLAHNCDQMGCSGNHISVYNPKSGVDQYYCVPPLYGQSVDEFRSKTEALLREEAGGVGRPADAVVSDVSSNRAVYANDVAAPASAQSVVAYFAVHKPNSNCDNMNCKGNVYARDPRTGAYLCYCVPQNWTASIAEYQTKLEEYLTLKANGVTGNAQAKAQTQAPAVAPMSPETLNQLKIALGLIPAPAVEGADVAAAAPAMAAEAQSAPVAAPEAQSAPAAASGEMEGGLVPMAEAVPQADAGAAPVIQ